MFLVDLHSWSISTLVDLHSTAHTAASIISKISLSRRRTESSAT